MSKEGETCSQPLARGHRGQCGKAFFAAGVTLYFCGRQERFCLFTEGVVKCEPGDSAEDWWRVPNKDKYEHEAISFSKKKEAN